MKPNKQTTIQTLLALGINGLAALVQHELGHDPFAAAVYVFANRRRDRVKIR